MNMPARLRRRRLAATLLLAICPVAGIGCGGRPATAPVSGQITLSGRPLGPGRIFFIPDKAKGTKGLAAEGGFQADGLYELHTYKPGDGAVLGLHRVVIVNRTEGGEEAASEPGPIPPRYWDAANSALTAEVEPGKNTINFDLQP